MKEWHFERLNEAEKKKVRRLFEAKQYRVLKDYYQLKKVFTGSYCGTCKASQVVREWTQDAINKGLL